MAKLRPYLVLINAKSVPQTARQTAVRYGEQYDTHKPACKAASESAGVADDKPENNPRRHCREGEPYWCIERCVGKNTRLGWVRAHGSQSALLPGVWTLYQGNRWVLHVRGKVAGFDTHDTAFVFCAMISRRMIFLVHYCGGGIYVIPPEGISYTLRRNSLLLIIRLS